MVEHRDYGRLRDSEWDEGPEPVTVSEQSQRGSMGLGLCYYPMPRRSAVPRRSHERRDRSHAPAPDPHDGTGYCPEEHFDAESWLILCRYHPELRVTDW